MMQGVTVSFCNAVWRFAAVNLMCLMLILAGGVLLGAGPALVACLWAMSRTRDRSVRRICRGMWREWRKEFFRTNMAFLPVAVALALLVFIMPLVQGVSLALVIGLTMLSAQLALAVLYVVSQLRCSLPDTLINSARMLLAVPIRLLAATLAFPTALLITVWQPLFGLYGAFSVAGWCCIALLGAMHDPATRRLIPENSQREALS